MGWRKLLARLRPVHIDELLYELRPAGVADSGVAGAGESDGLQIQRFDIAQPSPWPGVNAQLSPSREVYLVAVGDVIAHQSWIMTDVLNPAAFGFDSNVPVIAECTTDPAFRGRNLYPVTLRHIVEDVGRRRGLPFLYITVAPTNTASIRGIEKAGGRLLAHLCGWRLVTIGWPRPARGHR
jgi:hypothetical protein